MADPRVTAMAVATAMLKDRQVPTAKMSPSSLKPLVLSLLGAGWTPQQILDAARECYVISLKSMEYQLSRLRHDKVHRSEFKSDPTPRTDPDKARERIQEMREEYGLRSKGA